MKIENRTFIVSGGFVKVVRAYYPVSDISRSSSGLGLATVRDLASYNAYISIVDRSPPPTDLPASRVKFFETNITEVDQIERAVESTVAWTKETGAVLGGVINCAGVGTAGKIIDAHNEPHSLDLWNFTLAVNLTGTFNLTRLALKHLVKVQKEDGGHGERGVVIMVSSVAAVGVSLLQCTLSNSLRLSGRQYEGQVGQTAYSATKGAVRSMTLPLARDLGRHAIRVVTSTSHICVAHTVIPDLISAIQLHQAFLRAA